MTGFRFAYPYLILFCPAVKVKEPYFRIDSYGYKNEGKYE